jgi:hypothetical protein
MLCTCSSRSFASSIAGWFIGVSTMPGAMLFTLIRSGASSSASVRVRLRSTPFAAS